jgi:hypothetical protein
MIITSSAMTENGGNNMGDRVNISVEQLLKMNEELVHAVQQLSSYVRESIRGKDKNNEECVVIGAKRKGASLEASHEFKKVKKNFNNAVQSEAVKEPEQVGVGNQKQHCQTRSKRNYFCKRCTKNHPGRDCRGKSVRCNTCHIMGHRSFECRKKPTISTEQQNGKSIVRGDDKPKSDKDLPPGNSCNI